jgi:two-component system cell cycle sensor histidine kinase/response regulator CckA
VRTPSRSCARPRTSRTTFSRRQSWRCAREARFREIAEKIREVFWVTDPAKTRTLYVSPAYEETWGRTCASLYESPLSFVEAIHPDDREAVRARMAGQASGEYDEV